MFYGAVVWDPWLILSQIVCLQCLYYLTLGFFLSVLLGIRVPRMSLVYFFDFSTLSASSATGWCAIVSFLLCAFAGAVYLYLLIDRAKKCLDFAATLYIIHLFICIVYGGWPSSITWWVVNGICLAVMSLLGEWLCIRREMREIPITRLRSNINLDIDIKDQAGAELSGVSTGLNFFWLKDCLHLLIGKACHIPWRWPYEEVKCIKASNCLIFTLPYHAGLSAFVWKLPLIIS